MRGFDLQPDHIHCIFRRDTSWFALPALSVREVLLRPAIAHVPSTGPLLTGLCHVRSEFLPVFNLGPLLGGVQSSHANEAQMLVVISVDGNWGLLVDQVAALTSLETSVSAEGDSSSWFAAVLGWATYHDQVVRVLEPTTFYRLAEAALEQEWGGSHGEYRDGESSSHFSSHAPRQSSPPSDTQTHITCIETIVGRN